MFPILFYKKLNIGFNLKKDLIFLFIIFFSLIFIIKNFDYNLNLSGGGIVLHASNFLLDNNLLLYLSYPIFMFFLIKISVFKNYKNLILILILLMMTPQYHIFHKYYDPLIIILCFTVLNFGIKDDFFREKRYMLFLYSFYIFYYLIHFANHIIETNA